MILQLKLSRESLGKEEIELEILARLYKLLEGLFMVKVFRFGAMKTGPKRRLSQTVV